MHIWEQLGCITVLYTAVVNETSADLKVKEQDDWEREEG